MGLDDAEALASGGCGMLVHAVVTAGGGGIVPTTGEDIMGGTIGITEAAEFSSDIGSLGADAG